MPGRPLKRVSLWAKRQAAVASSDSRAFGRIGRRGGRGGTWRRELSDPNLDRASVENFQIDGFVLAIDRTDQVGGSRQVSKDTEDAIERMKSRVATELRRCRPLTSNVRQTPSSTLSRDLSNSTVCRRASRIYGAAAVRPRTGERVVGQRELRRAGGKECE